MVDQVLQKLIDFLETASPAFWHTIIKQVYLEASIRLVWVIGLIIACIIITKIIQHNIKDDDDWKLGYIGVLGFGVFAFCMLMSAIMWFVNPEFYAIRWILESVISGGK